MKAMRPATVIAKTLLASQLMLLLAGCGNFWEAPGGGSSGGTTPSTTTLAEPSSPITVGNTDTLTASVSPTAATGTVNFLSSGSSIGTASLSSGTATASPTFATVGTFSITADYEGDSTYASSTSSAVSITVNAATTDTSRPGAFDAAKATRATNLVLDTANVWPVTITAHLHSVAVVVLSGGTVQNIDGSGHCVFYSGSVLFAHGTEKNSGTSSTNGVYELSGGGYLAPEGTADLNCD